jgi:hypothetical protein
MDKVGLVLMVLGLVFSILGAVLSREWDKELDGNHNSSFVSSQRDKISIFRWTLVSVGILSMLLGLVLQVLVLKKRIRSSSRWSSRRSSQELSSVISSLSTPRASEYAPLSKEIGRHIQTYGSCVPPPLDD